MQPPLLICAQPLGDLGAAEVAQAVAAGIEQSGRPRPDLIELPVRGDAKTLLKQHDFDKRMRRAFAVIICADHLREGELRGSIAAELATGARQAGVACHAICAEDSIDALSARMYDLQTVRTAVDCADLQAAAADLSAEL